MDIMNINKIKKLSREIENIIATNEIKGKEHIEEYKLSDFQNIDKIIKVCDRCGNEFLPNFNSKDWQKYCDLNCRNKATRAQRYEIKLDKRQRPIDLFRKSIYEIKYRAKRDNRQIDLLGYDNILKKLKVLSAQRWNLTEIEYAKQLTDLKIIYKQIMERDKRRI